MNNIPLITILIVLLTGAAGTLTALTIQSQEVDMYLEPKDALLVPNDIFTVSVVIKSTIPVNVFQGTLRFNEKVLSIEKIDYNTSIADLWAEKPWYSNGDGTMNFIGGTTETDGFTGTGELILITFRALQEGDGTVWFNQARVLKHDGLGTDVVVKTTLDALFFVETSIPKEIVVLEKQTSKSSIVIIPDIAMTDLNGDGKQSVTDISIFMIDVTRQKPRSDFNQDGKVNLSDLSILMKATNK